MKNLSKQLFIFILFVMFSAQVFAQLKLENKITGLENPALQNALNRLKISQDLSKGTLTPKIINHFVEKAPNEIQTAIQPYGYFKSTVSTKLSHQNEIWTASYHVNPGPQLKITTLSVRLAGQGSKDSILLNTVHKFPIKQGDTFNAETYKKGENELLTATQNRGYLRATLTKNIILINLRHYTCKIDLVLNTGPRFYFGNVTFSKTPLNESFLRRYINFKFGQPFSYNKLLVLQQNLSGGGYFKGVSVVPLQKNAYKQHVPVNVDLLMNKKREYLFGIGYGTNTGVRGTLGYRNRFVNRWGHTLKANLTLSSVDRTLAAQYIIPGKDPAHDRYFISAGISEREPRHGESYIEKVGVGHIRNYQKWQRTFELIYQREQYRFHKGDHFKHAKLLMPSVTFERSTAKNKIKVDNGSKFSINIRGTSTDLASTVSFIQTTLQYKWIRTFFEDNKIILRGDLGYTAVHRLPKLPLSIRYYTGGMDGIRGFGYERIGPGRYLAIASAEYQRRITGNWYGAIFYDMGNAMDHWNEKLARGTGVGVIWQSPIGAVRVYIATALSEKGNPLRLEFSLGPEL